MDFEKEVLAASLDLPILVDFWAPWCGPCKVLGPVLEEVASERAEQFLLVKIDTEQHPDLSQEYQIRSIPNVKLFHNREVVAEFAGALTKVQLEKWLDENVPSDEKDSWQDILLQLDGMEAKEQIAVLEKFVGAHPTHEESKLKLARLLAFVRTEEAVDLVKEVKEGSTDFTLAQDIRTIGRLRSFTGGETEAHQYLAAASALAQGDDLEGAVEQIIKAVQLDRSIDNDLPRLAAIAIFRLLGSQDPVTKNTDAFLIWPFTKCRI